MALQYNLFRLVPIAIFHGALEIRAMMAVKILEDSVLVLQSAKMSFLGRWSILHRS